MFPERARLRKGRCPGRPKGGRLRIVLVARSASSRKADPGEAAREIADGLSGAVAAGGESAAVFFATDEYGPAFERISREISSRAGIGSVVGCTAEVVVSPLAGPVRSPGISALALSGLRGVERFFLPGLRGRSDEHGREIGRLAASGGETGTIVLFADSYNLAPDELLEGIAETAGAVPVIGAGATEKGSTGTTSVVAHGSSASNAVAGLVLRGVSVVPVVSPVLAPIGTWWTITAAEANRIYELDRRPALECVLRALPPTLRENPDEALGLVRIALAEPDATDAPLLRPIVGADPGRAALVVGDEVFGGTRIALAVRDPASAREGLAASLEKLSSVESLCGVLYVHSALGGEAPYGHPDLDVAYLQRELSRAAVAGFGSYVTFAPHRGRNRFHHFSGLLAGLAPRGSISEEHLWGR